MNRVESNYTKDKFRTLIIFITFLAIIVTIICINYKLVYEVKLSDEIIGYVINKNDVEKEIENYINSTSKNIVSRRITNLPQYKLTFVSKHIDVNDEQVISTIKSKALTTYRTYSIRFNGKEKIVVTNKKDTDQIVNKLDKNIGTKFDIVETYTTNLIAISQEEVKNTLSTLKLSKLTESKSIKKSVSKVSNKTTKKVATKITKKTISKAKKVTRKKSKKSKSKKTTTNKSNIWKLEIPKIGLNASISEGTSQSVLNKYIGHFTETVRKNGNVGLVAHNGGFAVNYFSKLNKLSKNDIIYYTYKGVRKKYKVVYKKRIQDTDWSKLYYTDDDRLTMITCVKNKPHLRLCVQAKAVK